MSEQNPWRMRTHSVVGATGPSGLGQKVIGTEEELQKDEAGYNEKKASTLGVCGQCGAVLHNEAEVAAVDERHEYVCGSCAHVRCVLDQVVTGPRAAIYVPIFGGPYCQRHGRQRRLLLAAVIVCTIVFLLVAIRGCSFYF